MFFHPVIGYINARAFGGRVEGKFGTAQSRINYSTKLKYTHGRLFPWKLKKISTDVMKKLSVITSD